MKGLLVEKKGVDIRCLKWHNEGYQEREIMKTLKLSKIKNEFFRMGDDRLWFKSGYDQDERAWRVCLVRDPLRYKLVDSKTEVQL